MFRNLLLVTLVAGCAASTLIHVHKFEFFVFSTTGDAQPGTYEMTCNEYFTENDPTARVGRILGAETRRDFYSARCSVRIEGKTYQCFFDNYSIDEFDATVMEYACAAFVEKWTRPVESDGDGGGGYSPP